MSSEEAKKALGQIYGGAAIALNGLVAGFMFAVVASQVALLLEKFKEGADLKQLFGHLLLSLFLIVPAVMLGISLVRNAREIERELEKL